MIQTLTILLLFQTIGELLSYALSLPISGSVIGMMLLFCYLLFKSELAKKMLPPSQKILSHLVLLFIPSSVGIMVHAQRIADEWLSIAVALIVSTVIALVVTAAVLNRMQK